MLSTLQGALIILLERSGLRHIILHVYPSNKLHKTHVHVDEATLSNPTHLSLLQRCYASASDVTCKTTSK